MGEPDCKVQLPLSCASKLVALEEGAERSDYHADGDGQGQDVLYNNLTSRSAGDKSADQGLDYDEDYKANDYAYKSFTHLRCYSVRILRKHQKVPLEQAQPL
jgi:hypothetical protein